MIKTKKDEKQNLHFKAFRFKIHPSDQQKQLINQTVGCCRFVYNYILNENIKSFEKTKKRYTETAAKKLLPRLKETFKWLSDSDSIALQASIEYQYEGFKKYKEQPKKELKKRAAKKCAEGYTPTAYDFKGHPTFKSKKNPVQSYTIKMTNNNIKITDNRISCRNSAGFVSPSPETSKATLSVSRCAAAVPAGILFRSFARCLIPRTNQASTMPLALIWD